MKDWVKYSVGTPVRVIGCINNHGVAIGSVITVSGLGSFPYSKDTGFSYRRIEGVCSFRSCDLEPVNPNDYYKYLKKGDYVVCIENTSGFNYRKINTIYQITKDSENSACIYFEKYLNSSRVKDFRLATYSEIEKCKANNNEPTSLEEKVEEVKPFEPTIKYSEQFFVKITKEFTQELFNATEKWLVENSIAPTVRHIETLEEVFINKIGFDCYYYNQFLHNHGIDNNSQSIQKELSISELKTLIGYSEPVKEEMETHKFEKGKWYKGSPNNFIKFYDLIKKDGYNELHYTEKIESREHKIKENYWANNEYENYAKNNPVDLTEIQEFLPEGHPDKISQYEYEVVHCKTQEEWDFVIDNFKTRLGVPLKKKYPEYECICVGGADKGEFCSLDWFKGRNSLIYSFQEWCDKFDHVNPFIVKEDSLLEEAKRRYPVGTKFWPAHLHSPRGLAKEFCIVSEKQEFKKDEDYIWLQVNHCRYNKTSNPEFGNCCYDFILNYKGKWAEIIDEEESPKTYEFNKGDLVVVEELKEKIAEIQKSPIIADKTNIKIGTRVIRGKDWSWGDQDGGEGNVGVVIDIKDLVAKVVWDNSIRSYTYYSIGFEGRYDLYLAPDEVSLRQNLHGKPRKMYKIGIDPAIETKEKGGRSSLEVDLIIID